MGKAFSTGLDKTAEDYQEEDVIKLLIDLRDGLRGGNGSERDDRPNGNENDRDDRDDRPNGNGDDRPDDRPDDRLDDRPDDRPDVRYNKKLTKDILDESGKKINKFYQERLKYFNEFR